MRRAQSVRHYTRASVPTIGSNDLGVLNEAPEDSTEVALRRQLLDKSKENDKVCGSSSSFNSRYFVADSASSFLQLRDQIQALQTQLAQRPPIEAIQELRKEYSNLELILQGTQRENERAMTELERLVSPASTIWKTIANISYCTRSIGADTERSFLSASSRNWQEAIGRCACLPRLLFLWKLTDPVPLLPHSRRLTSRLLLLVSLAQSPRVPPRLYFLPRCNTVPRRPRLTVT